MVEIEGLDGPIKFVFQDANGVLDYLIQAAPATGAILTAIVALWVYLLQRRQHWLDLERFRHSIRDRQFAVYQALREGIQSAMRFTVNTDEKGMDNVFESVRKFWPDSNYFFGDEIAPFFESTLDDIRAIQVACFQMRVMSSGTGADAGWEKHESAHASLRAKQEIILEMFRPYLEIDPRLIPNARQRHRTSFAGITLRRPKSPSK